MGPKVKISACAGAVIGLLLVLSTAPAAAAWTPSAPLEGVPAYGASYDKSRDPEADFRAASAAARAKNRRVLIVVGGDWCMWCFMLDRHLRNDAEAKQLFFDGFELMRVYYNDDNTNQAFLSRFPAFEVFPHFFVVEPDGRVRASVTADIFIRDAKYDTALIRSFVQQWQPR